MSLFNTTEISNPKFERDNLRFVTVKSKYLKGRGDLCVFVPKGSKQVDLPIVILLHGVYGSAWSWAFSGSAHLIAQDLIDRKIIQPMVLVMPSDGLWGDGSAFAKQGTLDFENWIVLDTIAAAKELIPQVKSSTQTFISGLSMGGFGALKLGIKYPKIFKSISAHSAITDLVQMKLFVEEDWSERLNDKDSNILALILANKKELPPLRFDCGTDDLLIKENRQLHEALIKENIDHEFEEFQGKHEWAYWQKHLVDSLVFFDSTSKDLPNFQWKDATKD